MRHGGGHNSFSNGYNKRDFTPSNGYSGRGDFSRDNLNRGDFTRDREIVRDNAGGRERGRTSEGEGGRGEGEAQN